MTILHLILFLSISQPVKGNINLILLLMKTEKSSKWKGAMNFKKFLMLKINKRLASLQDPSLMSVYDYLIIINFTQIISFSVTGGSVFFISIASLLINIKLPSF